MRLMDWLPLIIALPLLLLCYDALPYYLDVKPNVEALKTLGWIMSGCLGAISSYVLYFAEILWRARSGWRSDYRMSPGRDRGARQGSTRKEASLPIPANMANYPAVAPAMAVEGQASNSSLWSTASDSPYLFTGQGIYAEAVRASKRAATLIVEGKFTENREDNMKYSKKSSNQKVTRYRKNRTGSGAAAGGMVEIENTTPHRAPKLESDVAVPAAMSAIIGLAVSIGVFVIALATNRTLATALQFGSIAFIGTFLVALFQRLGVIDNGLNVREKITQTDTDDDSDTGEENTTHNMLQNPGQAREVSNKIASGNGGALRTAELLSFVTRCATIGTSEAKLGIGTSPQQRQQYKQLRDSLIELGIAEWKNEERRALGWELRMTPEQAAPIISAHVKQLHNLT